jgi:hypothetical protein
MNPLDQFLRDNSIISFEEAKTFYRCRKITTHGAFKRIQAYTYHKNGFPSSISDIFLSSEVIILFTKTSYSCDSVGEYLSIGFDNQPFFYKDLTFSKEFTDILPIYSLSDSQILTDKFFEMKLSFIASLYSEKKKPIDLSFSEMNKLTQSFKISPTVSEDFYIASFLYEKGRSLFKKVHIENVDDLIHLRNKILEARV